MRNAFEPSVRSSLRFLPELSCHPVFCSLRAKLVRSF